MFSDQRWLEQKKICYFSLHLQTDYGFCFLRKPYQLTSFMELQIYQK